MLESDGIDDEMNVTAEVEACAFQTGSAEDIILALKQENIQLKETNLKQEAELEKLRRDAETRQIELEGLRLQLESSHESHCKKNGLLSQHSGNSHGRCRNFPFITMSHESSGEEEEDEEGNGQLVIDEPPAKKIRKTENVLSGVSTSQAAYVKAIQRAGRFGCHSPMMGSPASGSLAEGGPAKEACDDGQPQESTLVKDDHPFAVDKDGRIVRRTMLKIEPEHGGIPVLPGEGDGAIGGVPESAKTEPEPNPRDLHEAGSISEFEGGYHIVWKGSQNGTDILHDAEGHRYCYHVNERTNYPRPHGSQAFWTCTGTNPVTKKKCKVLLRELDGRFTPITAKEHFAAPHPSARHFNQCQICVKRMGIRK